MLRFSSIRSIFFCFSLSLAACGGPPGGDTNGSDPGPGGSDQDSGAGGSPSGGDTAGNELGGTTSGGGADLGGGGGDEDGAVDSGMSSSGDDGGSMTADAGPVCKKACAPDDCGELVSDNCGGHLKCPTTCPEGQGCGLLRPDKCDAPPSNCTPKTQADACENKCGVVSDGCSSVYTCSATTNGVSCGAGQRCVEMEGASNRNTCATIAGGCVPQTCAQQQVVCGLTGDGCGGVLNCTLESGGCATGKVCGTGSNSGKCVDPPPPSCVALSLTAACAGTCGIVDDGCGTALNCELSPMTACMAPQTCGGGTTPGVCGSGGSACVPLNEQAACSGKCGTVSNGCGGSYTCNLANTGDTCDSNLGEECVLGVCTAPPCTPKNSMQACPATGGHKSCGQQPDGCGGTINCGGCAADEGCGLAGPSLCGPLPTCQPASCTDKCGTMADGCGGTITCSLANGGRACTGAEFCGATQANRCGTPPVTCTPLDCDDLGHSCGLATDGCGHAINCWDGCDESNTNCPGSCGTNNACLSNPTTGVQSCVAGVPPCTGSLCTSLPSGCTSGSPTRLTGIVRTPGREVSAGTFVNRLPVPNAIVYIPGDPSVALPSLFEGVAPGNAASCGRCEDEALVVDGQTILAAAVTNSRGEFTLEGRIPVGAAFELVIKVGKWRRVVSVPAGVAQACTTQALPAANTYLARNSTDGLGGTHLPKIAVSTGSVDEMECVFRAIGIDEGEFTVPTGTGRVHMYRSNGARMRVVSGCTGSYNPAGPNNTVSCTSAGAPVNGNGCTAGLPGCSLTYTDISVPDSNLYGSQNTINGYDLVVWDCEGGEVFEGRCSNNTSRACASANNCRVCSNDASRYCTGSSGCENGGTCPSAAAGGITCSTSNADRVRNYVDAGGRMFASHFSYVWIENNGTLDASADWGAGGSVEAGMGFLSLPSGPTVRTGANAVKSVVLRDWLTYQGALDGTTAGQLTSPTTPQFMINDPRDRAGANVGTSTDEWVYRNTVCSNDATRACTVNADCENGGVCSSTPRVQQLSFNTPYAAAETAICGRVAYSGFHVSDTDNDDSNDYFPGVCANTELTAQEKILAFMLFDLATCVSAGDPPQPPSCTRKTEAEVCPGTNDACGYVADGCGGVVDCAGCAQGFYCDGNTCRTQQCTPATCNSLGYNCGTYADGCGGIARNTQGSQGCGDCSGGQLCGLGGPGLCGSASCTPIPFATACPANSCGTVSNGCGGTWSCGTCTSGQVCGAGDAANRCGSGTCSQIPEATACQGKNCGVVSDGCGGSHDCGVCTAPDSCGGGGQANVCGHPQCTPFSQTQACNGKQCGWVSDGCGGAIQCGTCANGGVCGGAGPNLCGTQCTQTTCSFAGAECGAISDACGGVLSCGSCPQGQTCGAGGPNKCGTGQNCTPRDCATAGAQCGLVGDGCGGVLDCGGCSAPGQTCGGAGHANQCGTGSGGCNKQTCGAQNVECGAASDGCGGLLDCGGCALGYACERSQCEALPPILL
jgi:hypothetical protein